MIKAIIFDCFGVLVGRGYDDTYRHAGGDPIKDKRFIHDILAQASLGLIPEEEFSKTVAEHIGITVETYKQAVEEAEGPNFELLKLAKELRKNYKTAILSNVNNGVLERKIPAKWLKDCFDVLIVSAELGFIKPESKAYVHTAQELGVELEECVFIDDNPMFVQAAKSLGMKGIVYTEFESMKQQLDKILANSNS